jgi:hypothetical protein
MCGDVQQPDRHDKDEEKVRFHLPQLMRFEIHQSGLALHALQHDIRRINDKNNEPEAAP